MRNPLNKRIPRELKKNAGRYISVFLLLTATITIGSAFMSVMESMDSSLKNNQNDARIEDGQFTLDAKADEETLAELEEYGINVSNNIYKTVEEFDGNATLRLFINREEMNLVSVFEGTLPTTADEIAMDRLFAKNRDINVGDSVTIADKNYKMTGTISLPDYNSLFKDNSAILMETQNFGPCVMTQEGFDEIENQKITYCYSYRFKDAEITEEKETEILEDCVACLLDKGIRPVSLIPASENQGIAFLMEDMGKDGPMITVFIYIMIAVLAFVFAVLISNTIEEESSIIGTLRASGYTKGEMVLHYLTPTAIVAVVASAIGNLLGYTVMVQPFLNVYYTTYCLPPYTLIFSMRAFILTTIVPVIIMIAINFFVLIRKLSLSPLRFLRNDIKHGRQKRAVKLPNVSFFNRFRIRVILQNKSSYLVLFIGIFLSSFLLMFGIGMMPLITHYVDTVDDSLTYEYQYILKAPVPCDEGEKLTLAEMEADAPLGDDPISITLYGIGEDSEFFQNIPISKATNASDNHVQEAIFSKGVANKLGLKIGDEVTFTDEFEDETHQFKVADIVVYQGVMVVFLPQKSLNEMLDYEEDAFNCYVSNTKLDINEQFVARQINRSDMTGAAEQMLVSFKEVLVVVSAFSVCIYLVMMYLLTKVVVEKNAVHIAFMKVFGYEEKEISKLYLRATTIVVIVSLLICIPAEVVLFKVVLVLVMSLVEGWIDFYLPWTTYAEVVGIGLVSYLLIHMFHVKRIKKMPMNAALKQRE